MHKENISMEDKIKNYLLENLPFLNAGFTGIFLDNITGKLISYYGDEVGISDKNGAFFYLRENGEESYKVVNISAPKTLETSQDFKLVMYAKDLNVDEVKKCVLNALWNFKEINSTPISVISSSTNIGKIILTEYPKLKNEDRLSILKNLEFGSLLSFDIRITGKITVSNCECKICATC